jgi:hypothetical protein
MLKGILKIKNGLISLQGYMKLVISKLGNFFLNSPSRISIIGYTVYAWSRG